MRNCFNFFWWIIHSRWWSKLQKHNVSFTVAGFIHKCSHTRKCQCLVMWACIGSCNICASGCMCVCVWKQKEIKGKVECKINLNLCSYRLLVCNCFYLIQTIYQLFSLWIVTIKHHFVKNWGLLPCISLNLVYREIYIIVNFWKDWNLSCWKIFFYTRDWLLSVSNILIWPSRYRDERIT